MVQLNYYCKPRRPQKVLFPHFDHPTRDTMQRKSGISKKQKVGSSGSKKLAAGQTRLEQHFEAEREHCPYCAKQFGSVAALIEHAELQHAQQQQLQGTGCQQSAPQEAGTQWWKQAPSDPIVAHCRFNDGSPLQPVRLSALRDVAPVELVLHALPANLARGLLTELLTQSEGWVAGSWWFGGQQQTAPRTSATYSLAPTAGAAQVCARHLRLACSGHRKTGRVGFAADAHRALKTVPSVYM